MIAAPMEDFGFHYASDVAAAAQLLTAASSPDAHAAAFAAAFGHY